MSRIGNNPLRFAQAPNTIENIVFVVVTHLPDPSGNSITDYHGQRFEVIKTCLETMRDNSHRKHTFMVWDNGSEDGFKQWLQNEFKPDILVQSKNIGKNAARAMAIQSLPLGSIVCYSDDDILYSDNWLNPQIELLNHFPNVACVSGYPLRVMFRWGVENTMKWAKENAKIEQGRLMPKEWDMDYCESVGQDYQQYVEKTIKDIDYRATFNGKKAYLTAHHCQFIGYAVKILPALTMEHDKAMGDEKPLDVLMDKIGLRLSTTDRLCRHMGNVLDEKLKNEIMEKA